MSDFVFDNTASAPAPPAPEPVITNDGWFPDVEPAEIRLQMRLRDSVTADRLRPAIVRAIMHVNRQLSGWRAGQAAVTFADVPAGQIDGKSMLVQLYAGAIGAATKVELVERQRDLDLTGAGQRQVDELDSSIGELRRDVIHAVRDIRGEGRTVVDLI